MTPPELAQRIAAIAEVAHLLQRIEQLEEIGTALLGLHWVRGPVSAPEHRDILAEAQAVLARVR